MFRVRRIRVDEGSLLRAMRLAALADAPGDATTTLDRAVARDDEHWIAAAEANASGSLQATFFAERGETEEPGPAESGVVGMVGAYANRDGVVNVVGLWTAPGFRQLGVASGLLDAVAVWARDIGAVRLRAQRARPALLRRRGLRGHRIDHAVRARTRHSPGRARPHHLTPTHRKQIGWSREGDACRWRYRRQPWTSP